MHMARRPRSTQRTLISARQPSACELQSNLDKVAAWSPTGDTCPRPHPTSLAPPTTQTVASPASSASATARATRRVGAPQARGGHDQAPPQPRPRRRVARQREAAECHPPAKTLITRCAALQPLYFAWCQRPDRVEPGLRAAQDRLRISWEALSPSPAPGPRPPNGATELAWLQARLPTTLGGAGIHDTLALSGAAYAAFYTSRAGQRSSASAPSCVTLISPRVSPPRSPRHATRTRRSARVATTSRPSTPSSTRTSTTSSTERHARATGALPPRRPPARLPPPAHLPVVQA